MKQPQIVEYEKAIKLLFKYWTNTTDANIDWSYDRSLKSSYDSERAHFYPDELKRLYEASLGYNTIQTDGVDTEKVTGLLARRFDKPSENITQEDMERANSWKIPSLIAATNDLGFRPKEIEIAEASWFYPDEELVRIPADKSVKSSSSWIWACHSEPPTPSGSGWWSERRTQSTTTHH